MGHVRDVLLVDLEDVVASADFLCEEKQEEMKNGDEKNKFKTRAGRRQQTLTTQSTHILLRHAVGIELEDKRRSRAPKQKAKGCCPRLDQAHIARLLLAKERRRLARRCKVQQGLDGMGWDGMERKKMMEAFGTAAFGKLTAVSTESRLPDGQKGTGQMFGCCRGVLCGCDEWRHKYRRCGTRSAARPCQCQWRCRCLQREQKSGENASRELTQACFGYLAARLSSLPVLPMPALQWTKTGLLLPADKRRTLTASSRTEPVLEGTP